MVTLTLMGSNDTGKFSETVATRQLSKHHQKQLVPTGHRFCPLVPTVPLHYSIKYSFRQKLNKLTEYVFSCVHACLGYNQAVMIRNQFKSAPNIFAYN
jgi:hypothetical protein